MKPRGTLLVKDAKGKPVAFRSVQLDTFLPRTAIEYPLLLPKKALPPGRYTATVDFRYGASKLGYRRSAGSSRNLSRTFGFTVSPRQYTTVFRGAPAVTAPSSAAAQSTEPTGATPMLPWVMAGLAALVAVAVLGLTVGRRWLPPRS